MSFILFLIAGFIGGLMGGMGMGGGTLLIPILTLAMGVEQHVAQATNLIAFLPMAAFSVKMHADAGLLKPQGTLGVILPALVTSVIGGIFAAFLPASALKKLFGAFLIVLAVRQALTSELMPRHKLF